MAWGISDCWKQRICHANSFGSTYKVPVQSAFQARAMPGASSYLCKVNNFEVQEAPREEPIRADPRHTLLHCAPVSAPIQERSGRTRVGLGTGTSKTAIVRDNDGVAAIHRMMHKLVRQGPWSHLKRSPFE